MTANQGEVLREAGERLRIMATQKLASEMSEEDRENADWQGGYEWFCHEARWLRQTIRSALTALSQASESQSHPATEGLLADLAAYLAHPRCQNETLYEGHPTVLIRRAYEALDGRSPAEHWNSADMGLFKESIGRVAMAVETDKQ